MLQVKWDNDEITWESLASLRKSDPIIIAQYADERNLSVQQGWTWTRKIVKNAMKFLRMIKLRSGQMKKIVKKFKFGFEVPSIARIDVALNIDKRNVNNK